MFSVSLVTGLPIQAKADAAIRVAFKIRAIIGAGVLFAVKALGGFSNMHLSIMPTYR